MQARNFLVESGGNPLGTSDGRNDGVRFARTTAAGIFVSEWAPACFRENPLATVLSGHHTNRY